MEMETIKTIGISLLTSGATIGIYVNYFANKSIEYYKKEYQKDLHDYNLYALKRNEVYQKCYSLLIKSYRSLPVYSGRVNYPLFDGLKKEEIIEILDRILGKDNYIKPKDFKDIKLLNSLYYQNFGVKPYNDYYNYYLDNSIYLDENIDKIFKEINKKMYDLVTFYCQVRVERGNSNLEKNHKEEGEIREKLENEFDILKVKIKNSIVSNKIEEKKRLNLFKKIKSKFNKKGKQ